MTWWRRLLGLPEPDITPHYFRLPVSKETSDTLNKFGWASENNLTLTVTERAIIISNDLRPMSHAVREAEGAQPLAD